MGGRCDLFGSPSNRKTGRTFCILKFVIFLTTTIMWSRPIIRLRENRRRLLPY